MKICLKNAERKKIDNNLQYCHLLALKATKIVKGIKIVGFKNGNAVRVALPLSKFENILQTKNQFRGER